MTSYELTQGSTPLLVSMPHDGTDIPESIASRMTAHALDTPDTDWHVSRLYRFAPELGASIIRPRYSRYVIDLNRPADGHPLYPGADTTELCPTSSFDRSPIYHPNDAPDEAEIERRVERFWKPYHQALQSELTRLHEQHGVALLYEAHSIRSRVPRFFEGELPELNLGTADGKSCAHGLETALTTALARASSYRHVVNGRFKGGYITRAYGKPETQIHAVQLELSQATYTNEQHPFAYREDLAAEIQPILRALLETMLNWGAQAARHP